MIFHWSDGQCPPTLAFLPYLTRLSISGTLYTKLGRERHTEMREAQRYLSNAREILKGIPVENNTYTDIKPVREAFGVAYLAVLEAINEHLNKRGLTKKELPKSVDAYRHALKKHLAVHDGKLLREFEKLYDMLHIAGYYRGLLYDVDVVKEALRATKTFIEKVG